MATEYKTHEQKLTFYKSSEWQELRQVALERDNYECQMCKAEGRTHVDSIKEEGERKSVELNVHHKQPIEYHPKQALKLDNLQTLCLYHHNMVHGRLWSPKINKWASDEKW